MHNSDPKKKVLEVNKQVWQKGQDTYAPPTQALRQFPNIVNLSLKIAILKSFIFRTEHFQLQYRPSSDFHTAMRSKNCHPSASLLLHTVI